MVSQVNCALLFRIQLGIIALPDKISRRNIRKENNAAVCGQHFLTVHIVKIPTPVTVFRDHFVVGLLGVEVGRRLVVGSGELSSCQHGSLGAKTSVFRPCPDVNGAKRGYTEYGIVCLDQIILLLEL